jgi:hypothetical protein
LAVDVDTILSADETLIPDARTGVTPSEMVDRKLLVALGARPLPKRYGPRVLGPRRPAQASENLRAFS